MPNFSSFNPNPDNLRTLIFGRDETLEPQALATDTSGNLLTVIMDGTISNISIQSATITTGTIESVMGATITTGTIESVMGATITAGTINSVLGATITTGTIESVMGATITAGTINSVLGATITAGTISSLLGGTIDSVLGATITAGTINSVLGATITAGTINSVLGATITAGTINSVLGATITAGTINSVLGATITAGTINSVLGATITAGTINSVLGATITAGTLSSVTSISQKSFQEISNLGVTTANAYTGLATVTTSVFGTYSFFVYNVGPGANRADARVEISANGTNWYADTSTTTGIAVGSVDVLVPQRFLKYTRLAYRSSLTGNPTTIDVYFNGQGT